MKNLFLAVLLSATLINHANATSVRVDPNVLTEIVTVVGFAPTEYRGVFRFQILTTGVVREVSNKGEIKILAQISSELMEKLEQSVNQIAPLELAPPSGPICMDAPSIDILVVQNHAQQVQIQHTAGCRTTTSKDEIAVHVVELVKELNYSFNRFKNLP